MTLLYKIWAHSLLPKTHWKASNLKNGYLYKQQWLFTLIKQWSSTCCFRTWAPYYKYLLKILLASSKEAYCIQIILHHFRTGEVAQVMSACLASMRPWVQSPVQTKKVILYHLDCSLTWLFIN
jgi:hypothetical protein